MAFGIKREELMQWKQAVTSGQIAFLTHYWVDPDFPGIHSVTKAGCSDLKRLTDWCISNGLDPKYIHHRPPFPHFDLMGRKQKEILQREGFIDHVNRFKLL